jgi:hypothetical protein
MWRILAVPIVSAILMLTGCSERKPKASDRPAAYIPTTVGDKWVTADIAVGVPPYERVGDSWEWEKPGVAKWKYKAVKEEEVEVPAGKFKALRIEGEGTIQERAIKAVRPAKLTEWISPGYPTIKSITKVGDGSEICDGETTTVLKSFTPGKK